MATVIKAGESGQVVRRLATVDLADHLREAQSVINAARARAAGMIRDAEREVARMHDEARAKGHRDGLAAGLRDGRAQGFAEAHGEAQAEFNAKNTSLVSAMTTAVAAIEGMKTDLEIAARRDVLELAVAVAVKLTFGIGALHREAAEENLRRALGLVGRKTDLVVRVNPADRDSMVQFVPQLVQQLEGAGGIHIEANPDIAPGGCRVHTSDTDIDATLETQSAEIVRILLGETARHAGDSRTEATHE